MSSASSLTDHVERHYGRRDLPRLILAALTDAGKDVDNLKPEDLAPVDESHIRGRAGHRPVIPRTGGRALLGAAPGSIQAWS